MKIRRILKSKKYLICRQYIFYYVGDNLEDMKEVVQAELENMKKYFAINKFSLNCEKTSFMVFSNTIKEFSFLFSFSILIP